MNRVSLLKKILHLPADYWKYSPISMGSLKIYLIWFDSLGAKSSSLLIETPEIKILVDPGAAAMQPSYPLPPETKSRLRSIALSCIKEASKRANAVFISHYHYDHHVLPQEARNIYKGKKLWIKNPNIWINHSQWKRARLFLEQLLGNKISRFYVPAPGLKFEDPWEKFAFASRKDYGPYNDRKRELLQKGRAWLKGLFKIWESGPWVNEKKLEQEGIQFAEDKIFQAGSTRVRFTSALFHGVEYDRVGWVTAIVLERDGVKLIYTSDLQGPSIEDYAVWIAKENPQILILDGPATYLLGYMVNKINLQRAVENALFILKNISPSFFIYDHHLLRDSLYQERVKDIYQYAQTNNRNIITAAEWYGYKPLISLPGK